MGGNVPEITEETLSELNAKVAELDTAKSKLADFEKDNHKQREEIRGYKAQLKDVNPTEFDEYKQLDQKFQEASQKLLSIEKRSKVAPILLSLGVVDEKAQAIALEKIGDTEDFEAAAKKIVEDMPFLAAKTKVAIPNTGKINYDETKPDNGNLIKAGLTRKLRPK